MMKNQQGQRIPEVTFRARRDGDWIDITTDELFGGKRVGVFALPGAFTPTCSSSHLPRYNELTQTLKASGLDDVVCLSVNDGFVMEAWKEDQEAENVNLIPDGNGEFTEGIGMLVDKSDLGFGKRSWRYSMIVNDKVIEKMWIEPEKPGDPFEVSDADTMLNYLNPEAKPPSSVTLITKSGCPFCKEAKRLLDEQDLGYEEIPLGREVTSKSLRNLSGESTTPQVFVNGEHIGGTEDLKRYLEKSS